jgi:lipopolysaccharide exporter
LFVTIPIIARLLSPDDYGLMGIISVVILIVEVFSRTGFSTALIQKSGEIDDYLNAAWTADLLRGVLQGSVLLVLATPLARFYGSEQLALLLTATAIVPVFQGARSVGVTVLLFRRMDFRRLAFYETVCLFVGTVVKISLAFLLRNVWALLGGLVAQWLSAVVVSYWIAPFRPRFEVNLDKWRELWTFGQWEWLSATMGTLFNNGDELLVGKLLGTQALGYYHMGYRIANMVTSEGVYAVRRVLFPAFSSIQDDVARLRRAFLDFWQLSAILGFGFSVTLYVVASPLVSVFLGSKWEPMVPALKVLAIWGGLQVLKTATSPLFRSVNRPDWSAKSLTVRAIVMGLLIYPLSIQWELVGASLAVLLASVVDLPITMIWVSKSIDCRLLDLVKLLILPTIGVGMVVVVTGLERIVLSTTNDMAQLLAVSVVAVGTFGCVLLASDIFFKIGLRTKVMRLVKG